MASAAVVAKVAAVALDFKNKAQNDGFTNAVKDTAKNPLVFGTMIFPVVVAMIMFLIMAAGMAVVVSWTSSFTDVPTARAGQPSQVAVKELGELLPIFREAQDKYGVSWAILAAICKVETTLGTYPDGSVSSCGAVGFMQFMPRTWSGYSNPKARDDPNWRPLTVPPPPNSGGLPYDTDPKSIAEHGGYGTDADRDGFADPYNPKDAIFSAAAYLKNNHTEGQNWEDAIYAYNHDNRYVAEVLEIAETYQLDQIPMGSGEWPTPPGFPITATFRQIYGSSGVALWPDGHQGIDIACPEGTPLYAVIPGEVIIAGVDAQAYGNQVRIYNPVMQTIILYGHLSQINVTTGQQVQAGQVIGLSGNTGRTTGAHLHFEVRVGGKLCDPLGWLKPPTTNPDQPTNY